MQRVREIFGVRRRLLLSVAGLAAAVPVAFGLMNATPSGAQSQRQITSAAAPVHQYDVVSIKPIMPGANPNGFGAVYTNDGLNAKGVTVWWLLRAAYGVQRVQISGIPKSLDFERFDINAKLDGPTADEMRKLNPDQLSLVRRGMLQALLADRFKLAFHRETKELPVYFLGIAKNGPKLQVAKPDFVGPEDFDGIDGNRATDTVFVSLGGMVVGQAASIATLAGALSGQLGRPVVDKTGLTGTYDFTFKFSPANRLVAAPPGDAANGQPALAPSDPSGDSTLNTALKDHLGLKLESGKGPVEVFVIDHVERPSDN
jgi:uncharacterized protein (TIGR03435 family)